jgi:hypothetical protein
MSVIEAAQKFQAAFDEAPNHDWSELEDINQLPTIVEEVNLLEPKFAPEVEGATQLQWIKTPDDSYVLMLPENENVVLWEDALGKWIVRGTVNKQNIDSREPYEDFNTALMTAEMNVMMQGGKKLMSMLRQKGAAWQKEPPTKLQIGAILRAKMVPRELVHKLSRGQAQQIIARHRAKIEGRL